MSMTREEAIAVLEESKRQNEIMRDNPSTFWASHQMAEGVKNAKRRIEAFEIALTALRPVSREQVEQMRSRWVPLNNTQEHFCESCGVAFNLYAYCKNDYQFCPACGAPMTDEAVEMVMERMEALKDGSTTD